jgi:hypothetical protein
MIRVNEKTRSGAHLPGTQVSGSLLRRPSLGWANSRTVLGVKGSLRRGQPLRALDSCAPFRGNGLATGGSAGNQTQNEVCVREKLKTQLKPRYG